MYCFRGSGETLLRSYLRRLRRSFVGLPPFYVTGLRDFAELTPPDELSTVKPVLADRVLNQGIHPNIQSITGKGWGFKGIVEKSLIN